jgi:hypothetical protein
MKNNFLTICMAIVITGTFLTSCKKNSSSPAATSSSQMTFGVRAESTLDTVPASTATINWTAGTANISGFKFEARKHGLAIEVVSRNMTNVDLFALNPSLVGITLDTGTYNEIEIMVELSRSSTTDLPLVLKGSFTNTGGTAVPVEFDFNDNAEIKAEAKNVDVNGTTDLTTIIAMHLNKLLANVTATELGNATLTNGTIVISRTSNTHIYDQIKGDLSLCGFWNGFERHGRGDDH